jgi:hypothetical protein
MGAASALIIIEDSKLSGHLTEIDILASLRTPIVFLRESGKFSSWTGDPFMIGQDRLIMEYDADS